MGYTVLSPYKLGTCQTVAIDVASASIVTPVGLQTYAVMLVATSDCHIRIGHPPQAAVAGDTLIRAGFSPLVFGCAPGDVVAAIQDSAPGTLYVTELTH